MIELTKITPRKRSRLVRANRVFTSAISLVIS